jgi:hypothetical protein
MTKGSIVDSANGFPLTRKSVAWWLRNERLKKPVEMMCRDDFLLRDIARTLLSQEDASSSRGAKMIKAIIESFKYYWQFLWNHEADDLDCSELCHSDLERKPKLVYSCDGNVYSDIPITEYSDRINIELIQRYPYWVTGEIGWHEAQALAKGLGVEIEPEGL